MISFKSESKFLRLYNLKSCLIAILTFIPLERNGITIKNRTTIRKMTRTRQVREGYRFFGQREVSQNQAKKVINIPNQRGLRMTLTQNQPRTKDKGTRRQQR